jgi:hypothetical protein
MEFDSVIDIFDRLFDRTACRDSGCIEWLGGFSANGYGAIKYNGRMEGTHRMAYELCKEDIPAGLWVLHTCDNRACVNPDHLFLGTAKINKRDCMNKDRHAYGSRSGMAKLNNDKVRKIRQLLSAGELTEEAIGKMFDVSQTTVSQIGSNQIWMAVQ